MSEREYITYDVIVVGAGLSGLTAAYRLLQHDASLRILILEAKDRIGGRILSITLKGGNSDDLWDLGGHWVGRPQIHIVKLMRELDIEVHEQHSNGVKLARLSDGKIRKYTTSIPITSPFSPLDVYFLLNKADKLCKGVKLDEQPMSEKSRTLDSLTVENFKQSQCWTEGAKELFDSAIGVIFGAHPSQISMLFYLHYCQCAGGIYPLLESGKGSGQEWKVKGGAQSISLKLLENIGEESVWLQEPVDEIKQASNVITVTTKTGKTISSKYVIMAIPPHQAMCVNFTPSLPFNKKHLLHHMPVGHLIKFVITYVTPFWREDGLSGEVVSYDNFDFPNDGEVNKNGTSDNITKTPLTNEAPVSVVYDATTADGNAALVGFISGLAATKWTHKTETEQRRGVIVFLKSFFGEKAENYLDFIIKDWSKEPWNGGCPINYVTPGALSIYGHCLKEPFERVYWAGTETATVWTGFMNGAVQAGTRAANEILQKLYPDFVSPASQEDHYDDTSHQDIAARN